MPAISIGNFDGVHVGHRALLDEARRRAAGGRTVAVTFEPHPLAVLRPAEVPPRLTGRAERARLLREAGADEVLELEPTPDLLGRDPADFVAWLRERVPFTAVVEGADFRFGRGRAGDVAELGRLGAQLGFEVSVVPEVTAVLADRTVVRASSSMVRWLLRHGRVADAARLLGRPYELVAATEPGDRRGRSIGVPTMNLARADLAGAQLPADGVYAGEVGLPDGSAHPAAISVGRKPTFTSGAEEAICEAHLVDVERPLDRYGERIRVSFRRWLREQRRYDALDALLVQMRIDIERVRADAETIPA